MPVSRFVAYLVWLCCQGIELGFSCLCVRPAGQRTVRQLSHTERQAVLCGVPAWRLAMSTALEWHADIGAAGAESAEAAAAVEEALLGHLDAVLTEASLSTASPEETSVQVLLSYRVLTV